MKYVLFVCTHNAGRSQMAQALWRKHAPPDVRAESAGQTPAKTPWPEVVEVMGEIGIDISRERPKKLDLEMQLHADWAITLGCEGTCPYVPTRVDDWDIPDPHGRPISEVREIRDEIERRVRDFVDHRLDAVRGDRTAHQIRLARMLPDLNRELLSAWVAHHPRRGTGHRKERAPPALKTDPAGAFREEATTGPATGEPPKLNRALQKVAAHAIGRSLADPFHPYHTGNPCQCRVCRGVPHTGSEPV